MKLFVSGLLCFLIFSGSAVKILPPAQKIPGKVECEKYAWGIEGWAYHDSDSINNGSGKLNPVNGNPLNEFGIKHGVDISYTKPNNIDNTIYNKVQPEMDQLYVGWTVPGEWIRYNVIVSTSGTYIVSLMYTAHDDGQIIIEFDSKESLLGNVPSTYDAADTVAWRQWHHWNKVDLGEIKLKKGRQMFTLRTHAVGNMNYDFIEFRKKN